MKNYNVMNMNDAERVVDHLKRDGYDDYEVLEVLRDCPDMEGLKEEIKEAEAAVERLQAV